MNEREEGPVLEIYLKLPRLKVPGKKSSCNHNRSSENQTQTRDNVTGEKSKLWLQCKHISGHFSTAESWSSRADCFITKAYRLDLLNSPLILQYAPKSSAASDRSPSSNKLYLCPFSVFALLLHAPRLPVSPLELLNSERLSPIHIQHRPSILNNHLNLGLSKWVTPISLSLSPA